MSDTTPLHTAAEKRAALALLRLASAPENTHLWQGALWLCVAAGLEALGPLLGRRVIDHHLLVYDHDWSAVLALLAAGIVVGWGASIVRYFQLTRFAGVAMRSVRRLREKVYGHVLRLPMSFFDKAITGKLVSRVTNDTEQVKNLYIQVLFVMLDSLTTVVGALVAMAWLDLHLMLLVSLLIPAVILIVWVYQRWSGPAVARARELRSEINAQVAESIAGMAVIQASNAQTRFVERFDATNQQHFEARRGELRANAWLLRPMLDLINVLLLAMVIYSFGLRTFSGLEIGILYAFVSYVGRVVDPLIQITMQFSQLQQSVVAAARVNSLLKEPLAVPPTGRGRLTGGSVSMRNITFGYDPDRPVIHDLNLGIDQGQFIGVVGHTGSGKSTVLSLLLRFYTAQRGTIELDGIPLSEIGEDAFRSDVALVPQDPFLLSSTVRDNIAMGRTITDAEVEAAARAARCHDFIMRLENGYLTRLGEGGARLSVGQKQLIAIARSLSGHPRILFLDEATSHIDSETEQIVQEALTALRGKVTIIAVAHRLSTIRSADRIVVLNHGRLVEEGDHEALMEIPDGIYQRLYLLQQIDRLRGKPRPSGRGQERGRRSRPVWCI